MENWDWHIARRTSGSPKSISLWNVEMSHSRNMRSNTRLTKSICARLWNLAVLKRGSVPRNWICGRLARSNGIWSSDCLTTLPGTRKRRLEMSYNSLCSLPDAFDSVSPKRGRQSRLKCDASWFLYLMAGDGYRPLPSLIRYLLARGGLRLAMTKSRICSMPNLILWHGMKPCSGA